MNEKRKKLIINEINHWKTSKLIPEQYCNFLLTLYTGGDKEMVRKKNLFSLFWFWLVLAFLFILLIVLVIYFTDFLNAMQITIGIVSIVLVVLLAKKTEGQHLLLSYLYLLIGAMILFVLTIHIIVNILNASSTYVIMATFVHCVAWFLIGWKWRIHFFTVASVLGMIVLLFFTFFSRSLPFL